jgi:hypothetical protein
MRITWLCAALLLLSVRLDAGEGPKVFIDSISQPVQKDSILFRGRTTTSGTMPAASEIERVLVKQCPECVFVAKADRADYVLTFSAVDSGYEWSVTDNSGDGKRLASKHVVLEGSAYKDAIKVVRADWELNSGRRKVAPISEANVINMKLPENEEGVYELNVNGATVRLKVVKVPGRSQLLPPASSLSQNPSLP